MKKAIIAGIFGIVVASLGFAATAFAYETCIFDGCWGPTNDNYNYNWNESINTNTNDIFIGGSFGGGSYYGGGYDDGHRDWPECDDGRDNDRDGEYDYPDDDDCRSYSDDSEDGDNDDDDDNDDEDRPEVTTRSASSIGETSATLNGRVDGNGSNTRVWFEYSDDRDDVDNDEETDEESVGSGTTSFDERITGLRRDTTYYFRAVARNADGTDYGSIMSFRTDDNDNDNDDDEPECDSKKRGVSMISSSQRSSDPSRTSTTILPCPSTRVT